MLKLLTQTLLVFLVLSACALPVNGQDCLLGTPSHSQTLYFRFDRVDIDNTYAGNRATLSVLDSLFTNPACISSVDSVCIRAYSSPEGREAYNIKLSQRRSVAMKQYLTAHYPLLTHSRISLSAGGENWDGLRELVLQDTIFNEREEVLMILDAVKDPAKRERLVKRLNAGMAYRYIRTHILPLLRNAMVCTIYTDRRLRDTAIPCLSFRAKRRISSLMYAERVDSSTTLRMTGNRVLPTLCAAGRTNRPPGRYSALKTNLAAWATTAVNLAYEVQIGKQLSLDLPVMWSSWDLARTPALRIIIVQPELRYWLARPGEGHFFGLHAHVARYNLKWEDYRYQDTDYPLWGAGLSYGYSLPLNETWGMEFNFGVGYANSRYNTYHNVTDGSLTETRLLHYWGITRLGLSFIYKLSKP